MEEQFFATHMPSRVAMQVSVNVAQVDSFVAPHHKTADSLVDAVDERESLTVTRDVGVCERETVTVEDALAVSSLVVEGVGRCVSETVSVDVGRIVSVGVAAPVLLADLVGVGVGGGDKLIVFVGVGGGVLVAVCEPLGVPD